jgi:hypothetical protein
VAPRLGRLKEATLKHFVERLQPVFGPEALDDRSPRPDRVWNRIPDDVRSRVVTLALDEPELSWCIIFSAARFPARLPDR